ncbi:hypothetical protein [Nocardia sp. NPDC052112]|uniref:hypothetical protein n=1 Tax=Nocardia sp. NPDC052112 TaxID=3155646 RepID=UPI00341B597E
MNVIVIVSVVLVVAVIAAVVTRRRRRADSTHLTVADLQARLAEEAERLHPDGSVGVERAASRELGRSA